MRNADQTIRDALKKAQAVLCQYLEPDGPNENQTVKRLFGILKDPEVIRAQIASFERINLKQAI
jgi:hypothetical protein